MQTARGGRGLSNLSLFGGMEEQEKKAFANTLVSSLVSSGKLPNQPGDRDQIVSGLLDKRFFLSLENIFEKLTDPNTGGATAILASAFKGEREGRLAERSARASGRDDREAQARIREERIREQQARNLNPITGGLINQAIENAERGLGGKTGANFHENMFKISDNIFKAASALNEKETPFVTAAKEIAQASQAGFHVTIDDANISMDENTVDVIANKTAEKISDALGQISNNFMSVNRAINVIKNTLPTREKALLDAFMADKTGTVAKNYARGLNQTNN